MSHAVRCRSAGDQLARLVGVWTDVVEFERLTAAGRPSAAMASTA